MNPATILLVTFILYATIKGRMVFYIGLATGPVKKTDSTKAGNTVLSNGSANIGGKFIPDLLNRWFSTGKDALTQDERDLAGGVNDINSRTVPIHKDYFHTGP